MSGPSHPFKVGDFWDYLEPTAETDGGLDAAGFLARVQEDALLTLERCGVGRAEAAGSGVALLRARFDKGSLGDAACMALAASQMAQLALHVPFAPSVAALEMIKVGYTYAVLRSVAGDLTSDAAQRREVRGRQQGSAERTNWPKKALREAKIQTVVKLAPGELALPMPDGHSNWKPRLLAQRILAVWPAGERVPSESSVVGYVTEAIDRGLICLPQAAR